MLPIAHGFQKGRTTRFRRAAWGLLVLGAVGCADEPPGPREVPVSVGATDDRPADDAESRPPRAIATH